MSRLLENFQDKNHLEADPNDYDEHLISTVLLLLMQGRISPQQLLALEAES